MTNMRAFWTSVFQLSCVCVHTCMHFEQACFSYHAYAYIHTAADIKCACAMSIPRFIYKFFSGSTQRSNAKTVLEKKVAETADTQSAREPSPKRPKTSFRATDPLSSSKCLHLVGTKQESVFTNIKISSAIFICTRYICSVWEIVFNS